MAAKRFYRQGFLLLLFNFLSTAASERRFSDFKRCADEECSMLLCRGKAVKDFSGPDCRFLSIKKSETVYVYYKLSGRRADLWAGSVGSNFGYFPKDLLVINHIYTDKEHEIPAEETDFVCFETGFDKFHTYDVDLLLGSSAAEENDSNNNETSVRIQEAESTQTETQPSAQEVTESEKPTEHLEISKDLDQLPEDQSASLNKLELNASNETPLIKDFESGTEVVPDVSEGEKSEPALENGSERSETKDEPVTSEVESLPEGEFLDKQVSVSMGEQIPELKTSLGTTFDAVVTDEETTTKVTPQVEDVEKEADRQDVVTEISQDVTENKNEIPLLPFSEETPDAPALDSFAEQESPPAAQDDNPHAREDKNLWTAVFSAVTGGETTEGDVSSDEEEEDEDDEDAEAETQPISEKTEQEPLLSESENAPENITAPQDASHSSTVQQDVEEANNDAENPVFDGEDERTEEVITHKEGLYETLKPTDEPVHHQTGESVESESQKDIVSLPLDDKPDIKTQETTEDKKEEEDSKETEINKNDGGAEDSHVATEPVLDITFEENKTVSDQESAITTTERDQDLPTEEKQSNDSDVRVDEHVVDNKLPDQIPENVENKSSQTESPVEEAEVPEQPQTAEEEDENDTETEDQNEGKEEELLEDENALLISQSDDGHAGKPSPESTQPADASAEPEYSDAVMRLTLLREHFTDDDMERVQKLLGLKNLYKVEAMFLDLDTELQAARASHAKSTQDVENELERILEASENTILDKIEKMLDSREAKQDYEAHGDTSSSDEETEVLDDFQELGFSLRQKYSTASDSAPLATEKSLDSVQDEPLLNVEEDTPHVVEEKVDNAPETDRTNNLTAAGQEEESAQIEEEQVDQQEAAAVPDASVEVNAGQFNKNKDDQPGFPVSEEEEKLPEATLETPLDTSLEAEAEGLHSDDSVDMDSVESVTEIHEEETGFFTAGFVYTGLIFSGMKNKTAEWTTVMISLLPEEWKPGETLLGCPWPAVAITAVVGVLTFTLFFWRTILAVKKKEYLVDEKKLQAQIQALRKEKTDALTKISELQKQTEQLKENQKQSKETVSCKMKTIQDLESKVSEAEKAKIHIFEEKNKYAKLLEEERASSLANESRIEKLEKSNEKLQLSRKKIQEAFAKTTVLLDEAKIREDARTAQQKCVQKEFAALKEENKNLKATIKGWEEKHKELNEKIKVYQKSKKELEDSVVLKDHNLEVLSDLLADLDACDLQKGETKVLANGEVATDKKTVIRSRIRQMMDVSRIQTTLTVVEEERDRFMAKLLNEEKSRKDLEEKHQELEHAIGALKSEKSQVENQFKVLQQKNEIMVEMYQQKENALQQRLTKEELERRSKESLLSEVGGKALEAEEQVKILRQRINEMEAQMKKTEEVYKEQIKEQENKTHSNWVNARNAERALSQEKLESSKLREKLVVLTSQLNERRAPLFRPNSGQPAGPRQGDSYGPSPVSGGAPSPPIMIEGPRRPPSAPVGRRNDPYGPRPPSDPHGCYPDNKHIPGMDMMGPRSSSPANLDGTGPGSFLVSPIRDSSGSMAQGPPPGPGPHDPLLPPGPGVRLPPPGPYRLPRPGPYQIPPGPLPPNVPPPYHGPPLPANGHPGMPPPGPMGAEFGPRPANGLVFHPRPGPGPLIDPRGPPPPHFRPPPPHAFGPVPPPPGVRGPVGPRPPVPPDMRFPGPRDHTGPPMDLPPGVQPLLPARSGDAYGQAAPNAIQNSAGPQSRPAQDLHARQEAPQDSVVKP
ncbi:transport and Golgi organization protein 1 homolog isoform X2 [Kryptolebias marmoratus]|uniref:transport and Golgi organization protein 1 homolog isoform X2 n=1 Tax=Kryptolebias marmoratus TaxID=37003 RepID=UPI0007F8E830|nr:transport and Golgi organization protein 1 homolog isoform X2 [Kryptolebias marmoratus]